MDILKLFFDNDLRLDQLAKRGANKTEEDTTSTLSDFMSPTPTFSKYYLTGTLLEEEEFGLNILAHYEGILHQLNLAFNDQTFYTTAGPFNNLPKALSTITIGQVVVIHNSTAEAIPFAELEVDEESNVGHKTEPLRELLKTGAYVLYKEKAHHGYDLHLFSQANIYKQLFQALQPLVGDTLRFFSINSKRMRSERHFYFETWTLDRPPHGAEEVFPDTRL